MGRPACSGSQDNPGLFQEESPKKKKRSVASRWTDNPAYLRDRRERSLWGPCPLRREGAKVHERENRGWEKDQRPWLQLGRGHLTARPSLSLGGRQKSLWLRWEMETGVP